MPDPIAKRLEALERRRSIRSTDTNMRTRFMPPNLSPAVRAAFRAEVERDEALGHKILVVEFVTS